MVDSPVHPESTGSWRFAILFSRFTSIGLQQGTVKSLGLLIPSLVHRLNSNYQTVGFIVSMEYAVFLMTCPFVHLLSRRFDPRSIAMLGALLASLCVMLTSIVHSVWIMGVLLIIAGALTSPVYQTTQVLLHEYFSHKYAAANAIGSTGSQAGGMVLPLVTSTLLSAYGVDGALLFISAIFLHFVVIAATLRPRVYVNEVAGYSIAATDSSLNMTSLESSEEGESPIIDRNDPTINQNYTYSISTSLKGLISKAIDWLSDVADFQTLKAEKVYCAFILPCIFLHQMAFIGWALFMVPFVNSVGIPASRAAYLPLTGATGGLIGRLVFGGVLYLRPKWGKWFLVSGVTLSSISLVSYTVISILWFQLLCTFFAGFGMFATFSSFYAVLDNSVAKENFPGIIAFVSFTRGLGVATSGYVTGLISEMTGSFAVAFWFLGCMDACIVISVVFFAVFQNKRINQG